MKNISLIMMSLSLISIVKAAQIQPTLDKAGFQSQAFMTDIDRLRDSTSNISIQNMSPTQTFTLTGIFIQKLFQADCTTSYHDHHDHLYGTMWSDAITLDPYATTPLGAGYLYSMIMNYLYEAEHNVGPAATTPGSGAGTWCIQLGILQGGPAQYPTFAVTTDTSPSGSLSNVLAWTNNTNPTPIAITCYDTTSGEHLAQTCSTTSGLPLTQTFAGS